MAAKVSLKSRTIAALLTVLVTPAVNAQSGTYKWSLSPVLGTHTPQIESLNEKGLKAPFLGWGTVCTSNCVDDADAVRVTTNQSFGFDNELEAIGTNANIGLEFQWVQSEKHSFLMGMSTWEGSTEASMPASLPVQEIMRDTEYIRRVKLSYNEFYFGWKYSLMNRPGKYRLYSRASLNEVFDIDFREEHVFSIIGSDLDGVKRILIGKGQTTGVLMVQLGLGLEYFLKRNISVGFEGGYVFSDRSFGLKDTDSDTNFGGGDNVTLNPPIHPADQQSPLGYTPPEAGTAGPWEVNGVSDFPEVRDMELRFDGWKAAFRFTVYY